MPGLCRLNPAWMEEPGWKFWLRPHHNVNRGYCNLCRSDFDVGQGGKSNVRTHANGKKHKEIADPLLKGKQASIEEGTFIKISSKSATPPTEVEKENSLIASAPQAATSGVKNVKQSTSPACSPFLMKNEVSKAEILWCLEKVITHSSDRGAASATELFPLMFPDSIIAANIQLKKDKIGYTVTYGLGPFFQKELVKIVSVCSTYSISFDESLNTVVVKNQLDILVRFFNEATLLVETRYLTSVFLGHTRAKDLLPTITKAIVNLNLTLKKIQHVSTDGPNVNVKLMKDLRCYLKDLSGEGAPEPFDAGTCGIHVVHGAFRTGIDKTWPWVKTFLKCSFQFFYKWPARKADFIHMTGSEIFPLKFCDTRWVENQPVIKRSLEVIPHLKTFCSQTVIAKMYTDNGKLNEVKKNLSDDFLVPTLNFLLSVSVELEPFLTFFQSDAPLFPLLYQELLSILQTLASRFIKKEVLDKANTAKKLVGIDISNNENLLPATKVDIGHGAKMSCKKLKEKDVLIFRNQCRSFLIHCFSKLVNKSPLKYNITRGASCISPLVMSSSTLSLSRLDVALEVFTHRKQMTGYEADIVKKKYIYLCDKGKEEIKKWNIRTRLDVFLFGLCKKYDIVEPHFLKFLKQLLTIFNGNADVERGFSVNSDCLVENLREESLISQRLVYDKIRQEGGIANISISKDLILAVRNSSALRIEALESKKQAKNEKLRTKESLQKDLCLVEARKRTIAEKRREEDLELAEEEKTLKKKIKTLKEK